MILSLDLGTTHIKAGIFTESGELLHNTSQPTVIHNDSSGNTFYGAEQMWEGVINILINVLESVNPSDITIIGITSMAETGLLVNNKTGSERTEMLPWHDTRAVSQVIELTQGRDPFLQFSRSGIRPNFKCGLAKLLWLRDTSPHLLEGSTWLSTADYIAYRLTGMVATDYSLAGRTYAYQIDTLSWDVEWLHKLGLPGEIFPDAVPSTQPVGEISSSAASLVGLPTGIPVFICGHDHVCAAFAAVGTEPGKILDSIGTAEALIGSLDQAKLGKEEYRSGLVFGRHVIGWGYYWMGGLSTSGASLDWLRKILGDPQLSYQDFENLLNQIPPEPTKIIYLPYLAGSGSPHTDIHVRAAFIGLDKSHDRTTILKAVLEGTAFEMEYIRQAAQGIIEEPITTIKAAGGGSRLDQWVQIKADVSGCEIEVLTLSDITLLGAALVAGIGCGLYSDESEARSAVKKSPKAVFSPNHSHHLVYQQLFQEGYRALQQPLREISKNLSSTSYTGESDFH